MTLREQADKAALDAVRKDKPQRFTVGGSVAQDGSIVGGITYERTWKNGLGLVAYVKAYWNDQTIVAHTGKPKVSAGFELSKPF